MYTRRRNTVFLAERPSHLRSTATQGVSHMTSPDALLCALEHLFKRELPAETSCMEVTWD